MSAVYPQQAEEMFVKIVSLLGMSASATSETKERGIYLKVKTEEPGRLIGRKGQTLQSIQYLLNVMVQRGDSDFPRVFIDIADDGRPRPPRRERSEGEKNGERRERQPRRDRNEEDRPRRDRNDDRRDNRSEETPEATTPAAAAPAPLEDTVSAPDKAAAIAQAATKAHQEQAQEQSEKREERPRREERAPREERPRREERAPREERQRRPSDMSPADRARRQTLDAVKEVRRWGDAVKLPPLDVEMRKVVQEVLAEHSDVTMEGGLDEHVERKRVTLVLAEG